MKDFFKFDFSNFKGDLFGGFTAGIVALPLALAFGVSSGDKWVEISNKLRT